MSDDSAGNLDTLAAVVLVVTFLNTLDVETGADELDSVVEWSRWCAEQGLSGTSPLRDARRVRDALRDAVCGEQSVADALGCVRIGVRLDPVTGQPQLFPTKPLDAIVTAAVVLGVRGEWGRIKLCPAATCKFAFYDRSRNHSARWCSMASCGNRTKTKAFRERNRPA